MEIGSSKCDDFGNSRTLLKAEVIDTTHQKVLAALTNGLGVKFR
jgi:hypothetical protein